MVAGSCLRSIAGLVLAAWSVVRLPLTLLQWLRHDHSHRLRRQDWYFIAWRFTFPILTLLLVVTLSCVGHLTGVIGYALSAGTVWFYCNFLVIAMPFALVYRYPAFSPRLRALFWNGLAFFSLFNSLIECFVLTEGKRHTATHTITVGQSKLSWLMGNTMFGIVGLVCIPCIFAIQPRTIRIEVENDPYHEPLPLPTTGTVAVASYYPNDFPPQADEDDDDATMAPTPTTAISNRLLYATGLSLLFCFLAMICSNFPSQARTPASSLDMYWWPLYALSPALVGYFLYHSFLMPAPASRPTEALNVPDTQYDFNYLVMFTTMLIHVPIYLGHLCLTLFAVVAASQKDETSDTLKFVVSCLFLLVMQSYLFVLTRVVQTLSEPYAYPSLLYSAQLYYYLFWYLMVGSDTPIDLLYVAMLVVNNLHVVFANTGVYTDVTQLSVHCLHPKLQCLSMCLGSSVAVCFRATKSAAKGDDDRMSVPTMETGLPMSPATARNRRCFPLPDPPKLKDDAMSGPQLHRLYFLMKLAEQDMMADTSALVLVPSILSWLSWVETAEEAAAHGPPPLLNMWLRCLIMFFGRLGGSFLAREIFAYKMQKMPTSQQTGRDRIRIQRIMLTDFYRQFWYLAAVTTVCAFACFDKAGWPARYTFYTTT
ncbi:transmembrane protein [Achlya hypogyna]|uniref:Transmembrane protein n=1 Tax=Achlya hypogyna TaxID=1202772 RepID=A0A1V9ZED1_ACHHY|nr:transmembrane protein [Achlya hypogyna]